LTFDLLTLKVVSESRVTWATCMPILVFLGLSSSRVTPDVRDRRQTKASLNASESTAVHKSFVFSTTSRTTGYSVSSTSVI